MLAFVDQPNQWDLVYAASYQDQIAWKAGGNHFRYYFVCLAGLNTWEPTLCMSALSSKGWWKKHPGMVWKAGQKWGCLSCPANYKPKWGVNIEIMLAGQVMYMRSECPDLDTLDLQAMIAERDVYTRGMTPQQLYDAIPSFVPTPTAVMQVIGDPADGHCKITDVEFFNKLEMFKWAQITNFVKGLVQ